MGDETVRARYRQAIYPMLLLGVGLSVAQPVIAVGFLELPWWQRVLWPLIAIPVMWWYLLRRIVYRMDLTDTDLRLRAILGSWRIPLPELAEIGAPLHRNCIKVARRGGRSWAVLSGAGVVSFTEEVGRAAPAAEVRLTGTQRDMERLTRFFGDDRA